MLMKRLLMILGLLIGARLFGADAITVRLDEVVPNGSHTNIGFNCKFTIHNGSSASWYTTNLLTAPPGLALKISDLDGNELHRLYANPYMYYARNCPVIPPGDGKFNELYGIGGWHSRPFSLPEGVQVVRVRLEGTLSYSGYTNRLTSNIVEVHVP
jgi:hypothetical protein